MLTHLIMFAGFLHPERLPVMLMALLVLVAVTLLLLRKHGAKTTINVFGLRLAMLLAIGFALLTPSQVESAPEVAVQEEAWAFDSSTESQQSFVNRLRLSVFEGAAPNLVTARLSPIDARSFASAVQALDVPTQIETIAADTAQPPMLIGFDVPKTLQPGEPLVGTLKSTRDAEIVLKLDGKIIELDGGTFNAGAQDSGLHILTAELSVDGQIVQKIGTVIEVGPPPTVTAIGLSTAQQARVAELMPNINVRSLGVGDFNAASLRDGDGSVGAVICSVKSGAAMTAMQADTLQMFVARGGGLFVTGDDAKQVVVKYISDDFKELLPVILKADLKDPPEDLPVEEKPGIEEIAKVSLLFVVDRSTSMTAGTQGGASRWGVAVKSIEGSLTHVAGKGETDADESLATRVGIMAFTLKQTWLTKDGDSDDAKPILKTMLDYDRKSLVRELKALGSDEEYTDAGFNTDIYAAMENAIEVMSDEPSSVRMIVMLTDGGDNPENVVKGRVHRTLRERAIANEINIVTVGIGSAFTTDSPDARAANRVLTELATKPEFVHLTNGETTPAIFVDSVSRAFKAYDQKKKDEEEERKKKREADNELETVDVLPGTFSMILTAFGAQLFGHDALPDPAPKVAWFARNQARSDAATALSLDDKSKPSALSFRAHGLGRVAFWATGTKEESLGEVASWGDFPALFAASMRWILPREVTELTLLSDATPEGIKLLDPSPNADYFLRSGETEIPLTLTDEMLTAKTPLPEGPATVLERIDETENILGHIFVTQASTFSGVTRLEPDLSKKVTPQVSKAMSIEKLVPDTRLILYAVLFFLMVLPFERMARRRQ
ncbi:VWA domain-containing protein [Planctomycetota bacterium]|nr:VWA domain-containing protein [Planctomycetota bacterium]